MNTEAASGEGAEAVSSRNADKPLLLAALAAEMPVRALASRFCAVSKGGVSSMIVLMAYMMASDRSGSANSSTGT